MRRGAVGGHQVRESRVILSCPQHPGSQNQPRIGEGCDVTANYFEVFKRPNWHLMKYGVSFNPHIETMDERKAIVRQQGEKIGVYFFDGGKWLYCARRLPEPLELFSVRKTDTRIHKACKVGFLKVGEVPGTDEMNNVIMKTIFRRCLGMMKMTEIDGAYYDAEACIPIPQHGLTIWPGYLTSIRQHEEKLLLGIDLTFKVLRAETALDVFHDVRNRGGDFRAAYKTELEGKVVVTAYNNRSYRIDDIDFDKNPELTFRLSKTNRNVSYRNYYRTRYGQTIKDKKQPLLVCRRTRGDGDGDDQPVLLVPELCSMTELTENMRENFYLMEHLRKKWNPNSGQMDYVLAVKRRMNGNIVVQRQLNRWGLTLSEEIKQCTARRLLPAYVEVGAAIGALRFGEGLGDWAFTMKDAVPVNLEEWACAFPQQMRCEAEQLVSMLQHCAQSINIRLAYPKMISIQADMPSKLSNYQVPIREVPHPTMIVVVRHQLDDTSLLVDESMDGLIWVWGFGRKPQNHIAPNDEPNELMYYDIKVKAYFTSLHFARFPERILPRLQIAPNGRPDELMSYATKTMIEFASESLGAEPWKVELPF